MEDSLRRTMRVYVDGFPRDERGASRSKWWLFLCDRRRRQRAHVRVGDGLGMVSKDMGQRLRRASKGEQGAKSKRGEQEGEGGGDERDQHAGGGDGGGEGVEHVGDGLSKDGEREGVAQGGVGAMGAQAPLGAEALERGAVRGGAVVCAQVELALGRLRVHGVGAEQRLAGDVGVERVAEMQEEGGEGERDKEQDEGGESGEKGRHGRRLFRETHALEQRVGRVDALAVRVHQTVRVGEARVERDGGRRRRRRRRRAGGVAAAVGEMEVVVLVVLVMVVGVGARGARGARGGGRRGGGGGRGRGRGGGARQVDVDGAGRARRRRGAATETRHRARPHDCDVGRGARSLHAARQLRRQTARLSLRAASPTVRQLSVIALRALHVSTRAAWTTCTARKRREKLL